MTTLLQKYSISDDFIEKQPQYFSQHYTSVVKNHYPQTTHKDMEVELVTQTYLFRNILYTCHQQYLKDIIYNGLSFDDIINTEESYNYDKIYRKKDPPIRLLLASYFSVINNYYLLYVVTNTSDKCLKQIEFIANTKKFLNALSTYKSDTLHES